MKRKLYLYLYSIRGPPVNRKDAKSRPSKGFERLGEGLTYEIFVDTVAMIDLYYHWPTGRHLGVRRGGDSPSATLFFQCTSFIWTNPEHTCAGAGE